MHFRLLGLLGLFVALYVAPVAAQTPPASTGRFPKLTVTGSGSTGDVSGMSVTATGGAVARTAADRAGDILSAKDFGAKGDGITDDAMALNALFSAARARLGLNNNAGVRIALGSGTFRVNSTINMTGIRGPAVSVDGSGATVLCGMTGSICLDAFHTRYLRWRDLTVTTAPGAVPTVGIAWGQIDNTNVCDNIGMDGLFVSGSYSLAAGYVRNAETSHYNRVNFWNSASNAYGIAVDGYNILNVSSAFQPYTRTAFAATSNNENLFTSADVRTFSVGSIPILITDTTRHKWVRGYAAAVNGETLVKIYSGSNGNPFLDLDIHFEPNTPTTGVLFAGNATQRFVGFRFMDQEPQVTTLFAADAGVSSVSLVDADIRVGTMGRPGAVLFGSVGKFMVSGVVSYFGNGTGAAYNLPDAQFSGIKTVGSDLSHIGPGAIPAVMTGSLSSKLGVFSLNITDGGGYLVPGGGSNFPAITVSAPPLGGIQATAQVATMGFLGFGSGTTVRSGGTGYAVNDLLTLVGGTFTQAAQVRVTAVSGGSITAVSGATSGSYTSLPAENIAVTGGSGAGATLGNILWRVQTTSVTNAGAYDGAPTVSFSTGFFTAQATTNTFASAIGLASGSGYVAVTGTGVALNYRPFPLALSSIAVTDGGGYLFPSGGSSFPAITIDAPPSGGTQAVASVSNVGLLGLKPNTGPQTAGTGYTVGDVLTLSGGTSTQAAQIRVTAVGGGGEITAAQASNVGSYTSLPVEPISVTGGTGSGAKLGQLLWSVKGVSVTNSGAYNTAPNIAFASGFYTAKGTPVTASNAGLSGLTVSGTAATLGRSGPSGVPALSAGALIDNSGVRQALTGSGYTVPANTSLVRLTQTGTIASQAITLPTALADGQPVQFVNYAGAITALTFSPAVNGWTNGSTLAANTGLRVRWDATASAWYREQ